MALAMMSPYGRGKTGDAEAPDPNPAEILVAVTEMDLALSSAQRRSPRNEARRRAAGEARAIDLARDAGNARFAPESFLLVMRLHHPRRDQGTIIFSLSRPRMTAVRQDHPESSVDRKLLDILVCLVN